MPINVHADLRRVSLVSFALDRISYYSQESTAAKDLGTFKNRQTSAEEILSSTHDWINKSLSLAGTLRYVKSDTWLTVERGKSALHAELTYQLSDQSGSRLSVLDYRTLHFCESLISAKDFAQQCKITEGFYRVSGGVKYFAGSEEKYLLLDSYSRIEEVLVRG